MIVLCNRCLFYVTDVCFMLQMIVLCNRCLFYVTDDCFM